MDEVASTTEESAPPRARTRAIVWVTVIATALAGAGLIALADQRPSEAARSAAESYLPPDGDARVVEYAEGGRWVVESAHTTGVLFMLQQPGIAGSHQLNLITDQGRDVSQARYWRETWTDDSGELGQVTELYELATDGVRQLTLSGGTNGFSYDPGVLVLPADVAPGSTWSSSGDALPQNLLAYESTGSAREGENGCLLIDSTMLYTDPAQGGAQVQYSTETDTWCPGAGRTAAEFTTDGVGGSATVTPFENDIISESTAPRAVTFADYDSWSTANLEVVTTDPVFGESAFTTTTDGTSATTASGLVVFNTGVDVAAYRVDDGRAVRSWLARPGGTILWLTTIGDVVLVATTDRTVIAYDSAGKRGWKVELDDVLGAVPSTDGRGGVLLQVLDGSLLRLRLADGSEVWRASLSDDADVAAVAAGELVFAADRDGTLHALDIATGDTVWTTTVDKPARLAADSDRVFAVTVDGTLQVWDAATGLARWGVVFPGVPYDLVLTEDRVVLQSDEVTSAYDFAGGRAWTVAAADGLLSDGVRLIVVGQSVAVVADSQGNQLAQFAVADSDLGVVRRVILGPSGFWVVGSDFGVQAVGQ